MTASEDTTSTQYQSVILPRKDFFEFVVGEIPDPVFAAFHRHIGKRLLHFGHGIDLLFEGLGGNEAADIHRLLLPDDPSPDFPPPDFDAGFSHRTVFAAD